jgi:hypothetical protein
MPAPPIYQPPPAQPVSTSLPPLNYQPPPAYQSAASSGAARVLAVLPQARKMKALGLSTPYTIAFTSQPALFARLTNDVLSDTVRKSQAQSKAEGKGWLARVGDQMRAFGSAHLRYLEMTPQQILAEHKDNFAIDHNSVSLVKVKRGYEAGDEDGPGDEYIQIEFVTMAEKYKFRCSLSEREVLEILNNFYQGRIKR